MQAMYILVSFCNLRAAGIPPLGLLNTNTSEFRVLQLPSGVPRCTGITGLAISKRYVYAAMQAIVPDAGDLVGQSVLMIFDRTDLKLLNCYTFQLAVDIHSLLVSGHSLYAVSTGTDEVIRMQTRDAEIVSETVFWRPQPELPREDIHHLNAINQWQRELFVSGFGKKTERLWGSANDGFIFNITRNEKVTSGLHQPHSMVAIHDGIACCESRKMAVRVPGKPYVQHLPGYTRGLCRVGTKLFAATSMGRKTSKSTGLINNPDELGELDGNCTVSRLSIDNLELEETINLSAYSQEIYDLLPVGNVGQWPVAPELEWRDFTIRELGIILDQRTAWARRLNDELVARNATAEELQTRLDDQTALAEHQRQTRSLELASTQSKAEAVEQEREMLRQVIKQQTEQTSSLGSRIDLILSREGELQKMLVAASDERNELREKLLNADQERGQLLHQNEEIHAALYELQATLSSIQQNASSPGADQQEVDGKTADYRELVRRIREVVRTSLPTTGTVIVAAKGDDELLKLYGRRAWHFPQTEDGVYAGHHPANSAAAIAHLEALRAKGGDYLLLPNPMMWWLDHYPEFKQYLESHYRLLVRQEYTCLIFSLRQTAGTHRTTWQTQLKELVPAFQSKFDQDPAILDWDTGLNLAATFPECAIFSPPTTDRVLPYVDESVDVVVISSSDFVSVTEARRVAKAAVIKFSLDRNRPDQGAEFEVYWKSNGPAAEALTASIIIPCYNNHAQTETSWAAVRDTLPQNFKGEIIVVDDASTDKTADLLNRLAKSDERLKILSNKKSGGFLAACNRGAKAAKGEILVFLSSASLPMPGWLPPLLRVFRDYANAGAVGGKQLYPDGRLQEAGGIVFSNGSIGGFGDLDAEVDGPLYNFVREVDYCSGALLATQRSLFQGLQGFGTDFGSLGYGAADYCFKVRQKNYHVYYQPESAMVNLQNNASGTNSLQGEVEYQAASRERFATRWGDALKRQPLFPHGFDSATWQGLAAQYELRGMATQ